MGVDVDNKETVMAILNGFPAKYESLITMLNAFEGDENLFTLDLITSHQLQEKRRKEMRNGNTSEAARITISRNQRFNCTTLVFSHCKRRGHRESTSWDKHPSLRPNQNAVSTREVQNQAFVAESRFEAKSTNENFASLLGQKSCAPFKSANSHEVQWFIDSETSSHMTPGRSLFSSFISAQPFSVQMWDNSQAEIQGWGHIKIQLNANVYFQFYLLKIVLYVPGLH